MRTPRTTKPLRRKRPGLLLPLLLLAPLALLAFRPAPRRGVADEQVGGGGDMYADDAARERARSATTVTANG